MLARAALEFPATYGRRRRRRRTRYTMPMTIARTPPKIGSKFGCMVSGPLRSQDSFRFRCSSRAACITSAMISQCFFVAAATLSKRPNLTILQRHLNTLRMLEKSSVHTPRWSSPVKTRTYEPFDRTAKSPWLRAITTHTDGSLPSICVGPGS